ncbi:MAG: hypothetical protein ACR2JE_06615 [Acidobacteriaceae bacterium]
MDESTENHGMNSAMAEGMERLTAAAGMLERAVGLLEARHASTIGDRATGDVARIVATVERGETNQRQAELERKLREAEEQIAELKAQAMSPAIAAPAAIASGRKTLPLATTQLLAKQGVHSVDGLEAGSLDAALTGLSLEQRIAVKAQLIRTGALA